MTIDHEAAAASTDDDPTDADEPLEPAPPRTGKRVRRPRPPGDPQRKPLKRLHVAVPGSAVPGSSRPRAWDAAALIEADLPPLAFAVRDMFPVGVTLVAGPPKLGKTWLLIDAAVSVATGRDFLGCSTTQGHVLYLSLEGGEHGLQQRLKGVIRGDRVPEGALHLEPCWKTLPAGGLNAIRRYLIEKPETKMVVIDTLTSVRGKPTSRDRYQDDYELMKPLSDLGHDHGTAVVAVLHDRQAGAKDWLNKIAGTNGLTGAADSTCLLAGDRGAADATFHVTGRDCADSEHPLQSRKGEGWHRLEGPAIDYRISDTRRQILDYLRSHPEGATPKQISDALDISNNTVRQQLMKMVKAGTAAETQGSYTAAA